MKLSFDSASMPVKFYRDILLSIQVRINMVYKTITSKVNLFLNKSCGFFEE